jgi:S1-C subfamily serine protease
MPEELLFPYPHPKSVGLILDPRERATVIRVEKGTPAEESGFTRGDRILTLDGQILLSIADVQWVLHNTPAGGGSLRAEVERGGRHMEVTLTLPAGWRRHDTITWRSSTWGLRRMATGGLVLETLPPEERKKAGLAETNMALHVKHVGQFGPHAAAKQAGFQVSDIITSFDGKTDLKRESDLLHHALTRRKPGDRVAVTVLRAGKKVELMLPMQE